MLSLYLEPGVLTNAGKYAPLLDDLPAGVAELARVAQGLLIHEHLVSHYDVTLTDDERATVHLRRVERLLERIVTVDDRPLDVARPPARRTAGNCRHFTVLMVAMLRAQGVAARARCGFGRYFVDGFGEDHWVCEYWRADERRWALVDAQIDARQRGMFGIDFDLTDVPREEFLVAGDAWAACRAGEADPATFGLRAVDEAGMWWIAANLMRDAAALRNVELLPWDVWGAMPEPDVTIDDELRTLFDRLTELTRGPDDHPDELRRLLDEDERLRPPATVFNAVRRTREEV